MNNFQGYPFVNDLTGAMVVGLAFDLSINRLVLIRKLKPSWMVGLLNGVGGKIEPSESAVAAMVREFYEEAGVVTLEDDWHLFHWEQRFDGPELYFYACDIAGIIDQSSSQTREMVTIINPDDVYKLEADHELVYNLHFLIPMAHAYLKYPQHRYFPIQPRLNVTMTVQG